MEKVNKTVHTTYIARRISLTSAFRVFSSTGMTCNLIRKYSEAFQKAACADEGTILGISSASFDISYNKKIGNNEVDSLSQSDIDVHLWLSNTLGGFRPVAVSLYSHEDRFGTARCGWL